MRDDNEDEPDKPRPARRRHKHTGHREAAESVQPLRSDGDLDRHRHVC